ncbi:DUF2971 domain-containing protein [Acinetobacter guillouiae]|uniref:DUF2971 domain-containing protein n=1 Tax=Acinetobacter guillouiae TaxID=106649 RepID=UPI003AF69CF7
MKMDAEFIRKSFRDLIQDENFYYLYKHISIDPELHVFGVFTNNQLKYNFPVYFNDPFDCLFDIRIDADDFTQEECERVYGMKVPDSIWDLHSKNISERLNDQNLITEHINTFRKAELTITCFNSNPLSILMWSHYANNHQGMLLEFKIPKVNSLLEPIPVFYNDEYQTINIPWQTFGNSENESEFMSLLTRETVFRKSSEWSYEKEFRLIGDPSSNIESPLLQPYPPEYLSSVITGAKLQDDVVVKKLNEEIEMFNIKHNLNIKVYKAQLKKGFYLLEVPNHPRLDEITDK